MIERSFLSIPESAEEQWRRFEEVVRTEQADFFDGVGPIAGARAPGRLDVLGGVADYSGSLVLEMPIAQGACVAWQWRADRELRLRSLGVESEGLSGDVTIPLEDLVSESGRIRSIDEVRARLSLSPGERWAAYVAGCFYVMLAAYGKVSHGVVDARLGEQGANVLLASTVPLGAGVSSSAAIEVATTHALSRASGIEPSDLTLAAWCQRAENMVVGAPCGIMDQVTAALGGQDSLLVLRCQPHDLLGNQKIPPGWRLIGLDSRVKHSVAGARYARARVGAFMGLKVIQLESGGKLLDNYLCKMGSSAFAAYRDQIPVSLTGREYTELYGRLPDTVTRVIEDEVYHPRGCAEHPILENERARAFVALMHIASLRAEEVERRGEDGARPDRQLMIEAGELLYASHQSYSERLDLGAPETDLLVELIRERGPEEGLYGARITGGGAGGTIVVLCEADSAAAVVALERLAAEYERRTGIRPVPVVGSSPGAIRFGARQILRG